MFSGRVKTIFIRLVTLGDQGLFAVGNFLLTILLTRYYDDTAMAAYGIALSIALLLQGIQKNSYIIQNSVLERHLYKKRGRKILGQHMIAVFPVFVFLSVLSLFVVAYAPPSLLFQTIVATTACFAIYAQLEFERVLFIKYEKYIVPFITSFVFSVMVMALFFFHEYFSFYGIMGVLVLFAVLKSSLVFFIAGWLDMKGGLILLRSDFRRNSLASFMGVLGYSGYVHGPVFALGILSGPSQAAAFVALRGLMQPIQIIMRSMDVLDKNFFRSRSKGDGASVMSVMLRQVALYGGMSALISSVVCLFGEQIINTLYNGKHIEYVTLLYGWGIIAVLMSVTLPVESAVIVKKYLNRFNSLRLIFGAISCALCFVLIAPFGAYGAISITGGAMLVCFAVGVYVVWKRA